MCLGECVYVCVCVFTTCLHADVHSSSYTYVHVLYHVFRLLRAGADKHRTLVMWYSEVPSHMQIDLHLSFVCVRAACIQVTAEHTHTLSIVA